jgi:hypothetical protein
MNPRIIQGIHCEHLLLARIGANVFACSKIRHQIGGLKLLGDTEVKPKRAILTIEIDTPIHPRSLQTIISVSVGSIGRSLVGLIEDLGSKFKDGLDGIPLKHPL